MSTHEITARAPLSGPARDTTIDRPTRSALPVLLAGTFMIVLDFFIVNVALPAIQADLGASAGAVEWVVAGYGLTFAVLLICGGRLGDRYGRRRMFGVGLALFTAASVLCGVAWSPEVLIVARVEQGVAAALLSPQVLSLIGVLYDGEERARAMGVYGVVLGLAAAGGQLVGGLLIHADLLGLGWRGVFLINVPIGLVALALLGRCVPESRAARAERIDLVGTVLVTVGLVDLVLPLVEGRQQGWPLWTWLCLAGAPVALGTFAWQQRRAERRGGAPLLPPSLLRCPAVAAGLFTQLFFWCGQASFFLVFALYLQPGRGLDALGAGLVFTIVAAAYLVASAAAPGLGARHGRRVVAAGGALLASGHLLTAAVVATVGTGGSIAALAPGLLLIGAGMGLCIPPLTTIVMDVAGTQPALAGAAAGALTTVQQVGNALGVAITGVLFFGAVGGGYEHAFTVSLVQLAACGVLVTVLSRLLPGRR